MKRKVITNMKKNEVVKLFQRLLCDDVHIYSFPAIKSCSAMTVYRMKKKYVESGSSGLVHANKGKTPHTLINSEKVQRASKKAQMCLI
jgi:hypothetical protein